MGREMFDDITPPSHDDGNKQLPSNHSIRKIAPLATQERSVRRARRAERRQLPNDTSNGHSSGSSSLRRKNSFLSHFGIWAIAAVILVVALSAVGFVFIGKTTITIVPQKEDISLSSNVVHTAYREAENDELAFSILTNKLEATDSVTATGRETVEEKAAGQIVVYNNYSSASQRLIKNTRFEAPNGEIYRVRNSFVVPGMKDENTPGSIEITVYADKAGEDQNISALGTKFSIPGLKGDPRYDAFHAELKSPITGGYIGERAIVDENILNASRTKLQAQIRDQIWDTVKASAPESTEVFEGGNFVTFESAPLEYTQDNTALVKETAIIHTVAFDKGTLAKMLAVASLAAPEDGDIRIENPEALTLIIVNKDGVDISNDALIQFTLQGQTTLIWQIDVEQLKKDLVGKNSAALNTIMSGYPGIKSAQATIRPFWRNEFPSEIESISVEILPDN